MSRHKDEIFREDHEPESGEVHGRTKKREQVSYGPEEDDHGLIKDNDSVVRPSFHSKALLFEEFEVQKTEEEISDEETEEKLNQTNIYPQQNVEVVKEDKQEKTLKKSDDLIQERAEKIMAEAAADMDLSNTEEILNIWDLENHKWTLSLHLEKRIGEVSTTTKDVHEKINKLESFSKKLAKRIASLL